MKNLPSVKVDFKPIIKHWYYNIHGDNMVEGDNAAILVGKFEKWVALHNATVVKGSYRHMLLDSVVFDTEEDYVVFKLKYGIL